MSENLAFQEAFREELIDGKTVMMSPRPSFNHNRVASNIFWIFETYLKGKKCTPIADGMALYLNNNNHFVPDFMIVCNPDKIKDDGIYGAPDLVVEVLSPGTMRNDRTRKKEIYAECGVREYWLVSPGEKSVEIYHTDENEFILHDIYALHPDWELGQMTEQERSEVITHFKCSLFDDLDISLEDIIYSTF